MGMIRFRAPNLPIPPQQYNSDQFNEILRALRLYFSQLDSNTPIQAEFFRGQGYLITNNNAIFASNSDQNNPSTTAENKVSFNQVITSVGVSIQNNTRIRFQHPGRYLLNMTPQVANRGTSVAEIEFWAKKNNLNIGFFNNRFDVPVQKSSVIWGHTVPSVVFVVQIENPGNDFIEIAWQSNSTSVFLEHYPAGTNPARPEIPSVRLSVNQISALS